MHKASHKTLIKQFLILLGALFVGMLITAVVDSILSMAIDYNNPKTKFLVSFPVQNLFAFILPACIGMRFFSHNPVKSMRLRHGIRWIDAVVVLLVAACSVPIINWTAWWNSSLHLPESMSVVEEVLRAMEDEALAQTDIAVKGNSLGWMLMMVLGVGVITGIGEEFFFRGGLLACFANNKVNIHWAVLFVAITFSAIHFQFFGFIPRMLIGIWLGYLWYWSGSLWVPILAHAVNNGSVVVVNYLGEQGMISLQQFDSIGVENPAILVGSVVVTVAIICVYGKMFRRQVS